VGKHVERGVVGVGVPRLAAVAQEVLQLEAHRVPVVVAADLRTERGGYEAVKCMAWVLGGGLSITAEGRPHLGIRRPASGASAPPPHTHTLPPPQKKH
jgi:hypothetical protein